MMRKKALLAVSILCLVLSMCALAQAGSVKQLGKPGEWRATIAAVGMGGKLYSIESGGGLYITDPATGAWKPIGKPEFGNTAFLFASGGKLYTIEKDGSLYAINPADGTWKPVGKPGEWKATIAGVGAGGKLYSIESGGGLYVTDLASGTWRPIGKPEFGNTLLLFHDGAGLLSIEKGGSLYAISPSDGSWKSLGKPGEWKATVAGAGMGGKLYTVESGGALYVTDPATGAWKPAGSQLFSGTKFVAALDGRLAVIDGSGSLYLVEAGGSGATPAEARSLAPAAAAGGAAGGASDLIGTWVGDPDAQSQDPLFKKAAGGNKQMADVVLEMVRTTTLWVTAETMTAEALGEKGPPSRYKVVSSSGKDLVVENLDGEKKGSRATITFTDARHMKMFEASAPEKAFYYKKK